MIPSVFLSGWLANIAGLPERLPRATRMTNAGPHSAYLNTKNFLRSVYTRLGLTEELPESARALQPDVLAALKPFGFAYD
jgi:hypothetical protein